MFAVGNAKQPIGNLRQRNIPHREVQRTSSLRFENLYISRCVNGASRRKEAEKFGTIIIGLYFCNCVVNKIQQQFKIVPVCKGTKFLSKDKRFS